MAAGCEYVCDLCTEELATLLGEGEETLPPGDEPGGTKQSGVGRGKGEGHSWFTAVGWAAETGRG